LFSGLIAMRAIAYLLLLMGVLLPLSEARPAHFGPYYKNVKKGKKPKKFKSPKRTGPAKYNHHRKRRK
jgi:hypothetical protein